MFELLSTKNCLTNSCRITHAVFSFVIFSCLPDIDSIKVHLYKEMDKKRKRDKNYVGKSQRRFNVRGTNQCTWQTLGKICGEFLYPQHHGNTNRVFLVMENMAKS